MTIWSKILVSFLIAALTTGAWAAQSFPSTALAHDRPSGCHGHGGNIPAHAPGYECCLTGHDVAVLQTSHAPRPAAQYRQADPEVEPSSTAAILLVVQPSLLRSADPPGTTPLRI